MIGRGGSLRRAAAMSLRAMSSAEASSSGRVSQGYFAAQSCVDDLRYALQKPRFGWTSPAPTGSRLLSSLEEAAAPEPRQATYHVEVITGDVRGAGSQAPAAITLFGEDGESESHVIGAEESGAGFERATRKTYVLYSKDLGQLKRVLVQQLAPSQQPNAEDDDASTGTRWYLDRIEVKGLDGDHWTFPCGTWVGRPGSSSSGAGGATAVNGGVAAEVDGSEERNLIAADPHRDITRSSLHDPTHLRITRPLQIEASGIALPHPEKVQHGVKGVNRKGFGHGGEDSYFYASNSNGIFALGVADGVYEWRNMGIDAGLFSQQLVEYCRQAVELGTTDVLRVLQFAMKHIRRAGTQGSSTACIVLIDTLQGRLAAANVGDSGFILLGRGAGSHRGAGSSRGQLQIRYRSPQQEHSFGHPYQLGHHDAADEPEDAMLTTMPVYPGDVIVVGSDGLFDNLHDEEIVEIVGAETLQGTKTSVIAHKLAFAAFGASVDKKRMTPYSLGASSAFDMVYNGGKQDDITALVMELD